MKDHLSDVLLPFDVTGKPLWRTGIVDDDSPVQITLAQQSGMSASWLQAYTENNPPQVDDQVLVYQTETDVLIIGRIINGGE